MERSAPSQLCWCFSKKHTRSFQTGWFSAKLRCDLSAYLRAASLCCLTAVRWGLCFLFRWLKLNIPIFDLYFPLSSEFEDICILTHRYAGWPLQSKAADLSSYLPRASCWRQSLNMHCYEHKAAKLLPGLRDVYPDLDGGWGFPYS